MGYWDERAAEAVEKLKALLAKPLPVDQYDIGAEETFDPWELFPSVYGSYSSEFDEVALLVLRNIQLGCEGKYSEQAPETVAHEMFREMLCTGNLCDYGSSPRVCFANTGFAEVLPELISKWAAYSDLQWKAPQP